MDDYLFSNFLHDGELAAVVTTSVAYGVVDVPSAAVGADCESRSNSLIVSSTLESSRL